MYTFAILLRYIVQTYFLGSNAIYCNALHFKVLFNALLFTDCKCNNYNEANALNLFSFFYIPFNKTEQNMQNRQMKFPRSELAGEVYKHFSTQSSNFSQLKCYTIFSDETMSCRLIEK